MDPIDVQEEQEKLEEMRAVKEATHLSEQQRPFDPLHVPPLPALPPSTLSLFVASVPSQSSANRSHSTSPLREAKTEEGSIYNSATSSSHPTEEKGLVSDQEQPSQQKSNKKRKKKADSDPIEEKAKDKEKDQLNDAAKETLIEWKMNPLNVHLWEGGPARLESSWLKLIRAIKEQHGISTDRESLYNCYNNMNNTYRDRKTKQGGTGQAKLGPWKWHDVIDQHLSQSVKINRAVAIQSGVPFIPNHTELLII